MYSNLYKIELPFISKNYYKSNGDSYRGIAYYIFKANNNKLIYNTGQLIEINRGAANYADFYQSSSYMTSHKILKKYREKAFKTFDWKYEKKGVCQKKERSKFIGNLKYLNKLFITEKATLKTIDAFISGSNPSGGLKKPLNDPIRLEMKLPTIDKSTEKWMIFSMLSNLEHKSNNNNFFTLEQIQKIKTIPFEQFLNKKDIKVIPYGMKGFDIKYPKIKQTFISQNINKIFGNDYSEAFEKANLYVIPLVELDNIRKNIDIPEQILILKNKFKEEKIIKDKVRQVWGVNVRKDTSQLNYKKDFVRGLSSYDRAHIVGQKTILNKINKQRDKKEKNKHLIKVLISKENYILLPKDIHKYWDDDKITITKFGNIKNKSLEIYEFNKIISNGNNIYEVYNNVLTSERVNLLKMRNNFY